MNKNLLLLALILLLIIGCASPRGEKESDRIESDSLFVEDLIPLIPSGGEFLSMVHDVGMEYQPNIISPILSLDKFTLYRSQALNFGVYLTDFSYLLLFEKQTESIKYLYHIQEMAKQLGVENYFDDEFFNKLLTNLSNPDSIKKISVEQSALFFNKMNSIGNKDMVLLITTGAIIEGMYIFSIVIDDEHITEEVISRTIDLSFLFDSFYLHYSLSKPKDNAIEKLTEDIQELRNIFNSMAITQTSKAIRREGNIVLTSEVQHDVNQYNVSRMKVLVDAIRNNIVSQNY